MNILLVLMLLLPQTVFAHGKIKVIECFSKDNKKVLRGVPVKEKFIFRYYEEGVLQNEYKEVSITLSDTVESKKLTENIKFNLSKKTSIHIKILETPNREVREGFLYTSDYTLKKNSTCYAVY